MAGAGRVRGELVEWTDHTAVDTARDIAVPRPADDKYSRGVLGVVTGSERYPGAAVLGVQAAVRTGLGMVRYLGADRPTALVLQARPEIVTAPGRVQAWLLGSGTDAAERDDATRARFTRALGENRTSGVPLVLDAGALDLALETTGPAVLTPHAGEAATLLGLAGVRASRAEVSADPAAFAERAATATGHVVLLKGAVTHVCAPATPTSPARGIRIAAPSSWAATAGSGDVLGGVLGALLATHADDAADPRRLVELAASAAWLHARAADAASAGGPIAALDIAAALPTTIAALLAERIDVSPSS